MGLNYYASSPVLIPPSPAAFPQPLNKRHIPRYPQPPPSLNYLARVSNGQSGRKRSRDDGDDHDGEREASSRPIAVPQPKPEPTMGPGMTLIYPNEPALNISPESQSGTWMEESSEKSQNSTRPSLVARKSRCRLGDVPAVPTINGNDGIDPVVRQLGIGWKRLNETQQSAIAGSEMVIRKHFNLHNPSIVLHHEGLAIYVVRAEPASAQGYWTQWWLFRDDLKSCRFLCNDETLFERLNNKRCDDRGLWVPDIRYEGPEVFAKSTSFKPIVAAEMNLSSNGAVNMGDDIMNVETPLRAQNHSNEDIEMAGVA